MAVSAAKFRGVLDAIDPNANYTSQDIAKWLQGVPGLTDAQIAQAMDRANVSAYTMAQATGLNQRDVQQRYNAVAPKGEYFAPLSNFSDLEVRQWLEGNPNATDAEIAAAMTHFDVSPQQVAIVTGLPLSQVQSRFFTAQQDPAYEGFLDAYTQPKLGNADNPYGYTMKPQTFAQRQGPQVGLMQGALNDPSVLAAQKALNAPQQYAKTGATYGSGLLGAVGGGNVSVAPEVPDYSYTQPAAAGQTPNALSNLVNKYGTNTVSLNTGTNLTDDQWAAIKEMRDTLGIDNAFDSNSFMGALRAMGGVLTGNPLSLVLGAFQGMGYNTDAMKALNSWMTPEGLHGSSGGFTGSKSFYNYDPSASGGTQTGLPYNPTVDSLWSSPSLNTDSLTNPLGTAYGAQGPTESTGLINSLVSEYGP